MNQAYWFGVNYQRQRQGQPVEQRSAPPGLQQALEWDLGPMKPEDLDKAWCARRRYAVAVVDKFREGVEHARKEKGGTK